MHVSGIHVLVLLLLGAIVSSPHHASAQAAPKICSLADVGKQFCSDCKTTSKCEKENVAPVRKSSCTDKEACKILNDKFAVCKPIAETPCACGTKPTRCDAYDPDSQFVCLSGGVTTVSPCKDGRTCTDGACGIAPTEATTASLTNLCNEFGGTGFVPVIPECASAAFCLNGISQGPTDSCAAGQYYDIDEFECLPAPPQPCPVSCGTGACVDKGDCSKWYICDAGKLLDEETCTGDLPEFDSTTSGCVAAGQGTCPLNEGCDFDLITTTVPSTTISSSTTPTTTTPTTTTPTTTTPTTTTPTTTTPTTTTPTTTTPTTTTPTTTTPTTTIPTTTTPTTTSTTTKPTTTTPTTTKPTTTTPTTTSTTTTKPTTTTPTTTSTTTKPTTTTQTTTSTTTKPTTTTPTTTSTTTPTTTSTTATPTTTANHPATCGAANVGNRYAIAGECKKYLSCRLVGTNVYAYVEGTCLGTLVFNSKTSYCDTVTNVPQCA